MRRALPASLRGASQRISKWLTSSCPDHGSRLSPLISRHPSARQQDLLHGCTPTCTISAPREPTTGWRLTARASRDKTCSRAICSAVSQHSRSTETIPVLALRLSLKRDARLARHPIPPRQPGWTPLRHSASPPSVRPRRLMARCSGPGKPSREVQNPPRYRGLGYSPSTSRSFPVIGHWSQSGSTVRPRLSLPSPTRCRLHSPHPTNP